MPAPGARHALAATRGIPTEQLTALRSAAGHVPLDAKRAHDERVLLVRVARLGKGEGRVGRGKGQDAEEGGAAVEVAADRLDAPKLEPAVAAVVGQQAVLLAVF